MLKFLKNPETFLNNGNEHKKNYMEGLNSKIKSLKMADTSRNNIINIREWVTGFKIGKWQVCEILWPNPYLTNLFDSICILYLGVSYANCLNYQQQVISGAIPRWNVLVSISFLTKDYFLVESKWKEKLIWSA